MGVVERKGVGGQRVDKKDEGQNGRRGGKRT